MRNNLEKVRITVAVGIVLRLSSVVWRRAGAILLDDAHRGRLFVCVGFDSGMGGYTVECSP